MPLRWMFAAAAFALALAPRIAEACPYCAGRGDGGVARGVVIGAMVATPFIAAAIALPFIVRLLRRADAALPPGPEIHGETEPSPMEKDTGNE